MKKNRIILLLVFLIAGCTNQQSQPKITETLCKNESGGLISGHISSEVEYTAKGDELTSIKSHSVYEGGYLQKFDSTIEEWHEYKNRLNLIPGVKTTITVSDHSKLLADDTLLIDFDEKTKLEDIQAENLFMPTNDIGSPNKSDFAYSISVLKLDNDKKPTHASLELSVKYLEENGYSCDTK